MIFFLSFVAKYIIDVYFPLFFLSLIHPITSSADEIKNAITIGRYMTDIPSYSVNTANIVSTRTIILVLF